MVNNKQFTPHTTQIHHVDIDELATIRNRRALKRLVIQQSLSDRILKTIAIASFVSTSVLGIGALGCWGLEIFEANTQSVVDTKHYEWQTRKHMCLGWTLFTLSSFLGSVSLGKKSH
ncbi:MAG: hypothetical protein KME21_05510 [Desmonostoc vinosum HA7617-LM4]|jgi:hypothetical protein|nr:hypothetical protein [Desmonostoc vinosum HA7617-LM4]